MTVCADCSRRGTLLAELAGAIERLRLDRWELIGLLALSDEQLIDAVSAKTMRAIGANRHPSAGVCRHDPRYPARLAELECPPAALHIAAERPERLPCHAPGS
jgi:predicted Rossmann fold nucleotide-binding protein DprA/Smf involved in DNA uptake